MSKEASKSVHVTTPAQPPKEKKEKVTLGSIPAEKWGQKEINKVAARIEADFKLVPVDKRRRAMGMIVQMLEELTYTPEADAPASAPSSAPPAQTAIESRYAGLANAVNVTERGV